MGIGGSFKFPRDNPLLANTIPLPGGTTGGSLAARRRFQETAFWDPEIETDAQGRATVSFAWPDDVTTWKADARGWTKAGVVGEATVEIVTRKPFLARLETPRFFMERDASTVTAVLQNERDANQIADVHLDLGGDGLRIDAEAPGFVPGVGGDALHRRVLVRAHGLKRVDWPIRALKAGDSRLRVTAKTTRDEDGVERVLSTLTHGVEKDVIRTGVLRGEGEREIKLDAPAERQPGSGQLVVTVSPSAAAAMMEALPYLVDYPYGCVEQTLSRFLPAVQVRDALTALKVDLADLAQRAEARHAALSARKPRRPFLDSPYGYPDGSPAYRAALEQARRTWSWRATRDPVTDPARLEAMVKDGLTRLRDFQHPDGGWGWWRDDSSDGTMTAHVLYGLMQARAVGIAVPKGLLQRGFKYLAGAFKREKSYQQLAYYGFVLALDPPQRERALAVLKSVVYPQRAELSPYSLALLALAFRRLGRADLSDNVREKLGDWAKEDAANGTLHYEREVGRPWAWYNNAVESNAAILKLLLETTPDAPQVDRLAKWLIEQRRGAAWRTTRETAAALASLAAYVRRRKELQPDCTVSLDFGGRASRAFRFTPENALWSDGEFVVPDTQLGKGPTTLRIRLEGTGTAYYSVHLRSYTRAEAIIGASHGVRVLRRLFRLERDAASGRTRRRELFATDRIRSGDLLEVSLRIRSANPYEYLVIEDPKPAGCEPVALQSGTTYANGLCADVEVRDRRTAFFITHLPAGVRTIRYQLRVEAPGRYHLLPARAYAMYAPEVRSLSDELYVNVAEAGR